MKHKYYWRCTVTAEMTSLLFLLLQLDSSKSRSTGRPVQGIAVCYPQSTHYPATYTFTLPYLHLSSLILISRIYFNCIQVKQPLYTPICVVYANVILVLPHRRSLTDSALNMQYEIIIFTFQSISES